MSHIKGKKGPSSRKPATKQTKTPRATPTKKRQSAPSTVSPVHRRPKDDKSPRRKLTKKRESAPSPVSPVNRRPRDDKTKRKNRSGSALTTWGSSGKTGKMKKDRSRRYDESLGLESTLTGRAGTIMGFLDDITVGIEEEKSMEMGAPTIATPKEETKRKREKSKKKRARSQTMRAKSVTPKGRSHTTMGMNEDKAPSLRHGASVPAGSKINRRSSANTNASQCTKKRRQSTKNKGTPRRSKSKKATSRPNVKQTESQMRIEVTQDDEPEFQKRRTWRSDVHVRKSALKKSHQKSSFRYDEALPMENERMAMFTAMFADIDSAAADAKKMAKLKKGRSLLGDEMKEVEGSAMIDVLHEYCQKNKKEKEEDMAFQMEMSDDDDDEVKLNLHALTDASLDLELKDIDYEVATSPVHRRPKDDNSPDPRRHKGSSHEIGKNGSAQTIDWEEWGCTDDRLVRSTKVDKEVLDWNDITTMAMEPK